MPSSGANETCVGGSPMGPGGYGYSGHVGDYEQAESVCSGYCGLLFANKTAVAVADAFFQLIICLFGMIKAGRSRII